jgi:hypothetical protein
MMKSAFYALLLCFFAFASVHAQTPVSGGIYVNTTWSLANSPYILTGSVVVFPGKTLTIEPGVEVRVKYDGVPNIGTMNYLEIRGSLVAVGTPNSPIVFTGDTIPTEYTWLGINVKATQGGQVTMDYFEFNNSFYGIYSDQQGAPTWDLHNCTFRYNNYALQPFGPMNLYDCVFEFNGQAIGSGWQLNYDIFLKRCEFSSNIACNGFQNFLSADSCLIRDNTNGLWYGNGPFTHCLFERNTYGIYAVHGNISHCTFNNNHRGLMEFSGFADSCSFTANGLAAEMGTGGRLMHSTFVDDTIAIAYASALTANTPAPVVLENQICGSVDYYFENKSDLNFALDQNCFCETDSTIIEGLIFDGYDDFTRGLFNYAIYDSTCQNILQYVSKVNLPTAIAPNRSSAFKLYPVPAGDQLFLSVPEALRGSSLTATLLDAQGRVLGNPLRIDAAQPAWDLRTLPAGMYFIRIDGTQPATLRFNRAL